VICRSAHRLTAARAPDRGGALQRMFGAVYGCQIHRTMARDCNVAKAPARHAGGVPTINGAPPVRRAVGRSRGGAQVRLDSARGKPLNRRGNRKPRPGLDPGPQRQTNEAPDHVRGAGRVQ